MKGICLWCKKEAELSRHHHPIKKEHGGKETVAICFDCHTAFHVTQEPDKHAFPRKPRKTKKPIQLDKCESCQKDITGVTNTVDAKRYCFKCFVIVRQAKRAEAEKEKNAWVTEWMYAKKFFCPKCKVRKNDLGVTFANIGQVCIKCGTICTQLKVEVPKQIKNNQD